MARLRDVFNADDDSFQKLQFRQMPIKIDDNIFFLMSLDPVFMDGEEHPGPSKTVFNQFAKKCQILSQDEFEDALCVSFDDENFKAILNQTIQCIGCRRSAESFLQNHQSIPYTAFWPLCVEDNGLAYLAPDEVNPKFVCNLFESANSCTQNFADTFNKSKIGRRCILHTMDSKRSRHISTWFDIWDAMDDNCKIRAVRIDFQCLQNTLEEHLKKHKFCTECKTRVKRACNILIGEVVPEPDSGYKESLYKDIECCKESKHLHVNLKTEYIVDLMAQIAPEYTKSIYKERHAKTMETAQEEVVTCVGVCVFEQCLRISHRFREEKGSWEFIMCTAVQALKCNFELAVEEKLGVSQLELLCKELDQKDIVKQQRKERKKLNRKKNKEKKVDESVEGVKAEANVEPSVLKSVTQKKKGSAQNWVYRSLMEQLEENNEETDFVPPEISLVSSPSWTKERQNLREDIQLKFAEMISKEIPPIAMRKNVRRKVVVESFKCICSNCTEKYCIAAPKSVADNADSCRDRDASASKKGTKQGNKGCLGGGQINRNYKGKNRR